MTSNIFVFGTKESSTAVKPNYTIDLKDQVHALQWSPFDWSQDLICIAFTNTICVASCKLNHETDSLEFKIIYEFHNNNRANCIAWSPKTSLTVVPNCLSFCTAGSAGSYYQLNIFESDMLETHNCRILNGHFDYINEVAYEPENRWIASVSDDHTCRLWNIEDNYNCEVVFQLTSPGVSVFWHTEDTGKLLVAERVGVVRLYNAIAQLAILSLEANDILSSAHWCPTDSQKVAGFTGEKLLIWDLTKPSRLIESNSIHSERGGIVRFNSSGELVATLSLVGGVLKVSHVMSKVILLSAHVKLPCGLSWHQRLSIVTSANDKQLCFWKLNTK